MGLAAELVIGEGAVNLDVLIEEHRRMVFRIAYSVLRNQHDAEDAAQEAFLRVWRTSDKLAGVADPKAWIARIAWNVAHDRRRTTPPETDLESLASGVAERYARRPDVEEIAAGAELQRLLETLIAGLPPKLRDVVVLSTVEELGASEIGRVLGMSSAAVRVRLFQARRLLRGKLERLLIHHKDTKTQRDTK